MKVHLHKTSDHTGRKGKNLEINTLEGLVNLIDECDQEVIINHIKCDEGDWLSIEIYDTLRE